MPPVFKSLVSIAVWILFIFGFLALVGGFVRALRGSELRLVFSYFGFGILSLFLSVVAVKLRSTLD